MNNNNNSHSKVVSNWSNDFTCQPQYIYHPTTEQEIIAIIKNCNAKKIKLRIAGSKHSYTPLIISNSALIFLDQYTGIENIDHKNLEVTVKAGTTIQNLERMLFKNKLSIYNLGDINEQTLGGLIGTASHGTGAEFGNVSTQISGLTLITANGDLLECSPNNNVDIFRAAQLSLGALGIIIKVKLKVLPLYYVEQTRGLVDFSHAIENLEKNFTENRNYEFFWFPYTDFALEKKTNLISGPVKNHVIKKFFNDYCLENGVLWLNSELSRLMPKLYRKHANKLVKAFNENITLQMSSLDAYATPRLVKDAEIEYAIPKVNAKQTLWQLHDLLQTSPEHISFPIEVRCSKQDDIYLSPAYQRDCIWIAVHTYRKDPHETIFRAAEQVFLANAGRPHWGKMHWLENHDLQNMYPCWQQFQTIRRLLDPQSLFLNDYLQKLFKD